MFAQKQGSPDHKDYSILVVLARGLYMWADVMASLAQAIKRQAAGLERWYQARRPPMDGQRNVAMQGEGPPVTEPPADWLKRAYVGDPPAHWVAHIRARAPHLLGNWRPGSRFPGLRRYTVPSSRGSTGERMDTRAPDVGADPSALSVSRVAGKAAILQAGLSWQANKETPAWVKQQNVATGASQSGMELGAGMQSGQIGEEANRYAGGQAGAAQRPPPSGVAGLAIPPLARQRVGFRLLPSFAGRYIKSTTPVDSSSGPVAASSMPSPAIREKRDAGHPDSLSATGGRGEDREFRSSWRSPDLGIPAKVDQVYTHEEQKVLFDEWTEVASGPVGDAVRSPTASPVSNSAHKLPGKLFQASRRATRPNDLPGEAPASMSEQKRVAQRQGRESGQFSEFPGTMGEGMKNSLPQMELSTSANGPDKVYVPLEEQWSFAISGERREDGIEAMHSTGEDDSRWPTLPDYEGAHAAGARIVQREAAWRARERMERVDREQKGQLWNV